MTQLEAWLQQIESDFRTAELLHDQNDEQLFCQVIAKYQQITEKCVKAMVAAVLELGVEFDNISPSHHPSKEISGLKNINLSLDRTSVEYIDRTFPRESSQIIEELCDLAPQFPKKGDVFRKNTEYPFQEHGAWVSPASLGVYSDSDVKKYRNFVWVLRKRTRRFVGLVKLRPGHRNDAYKPQL
jgi:hypothetical protein